jgi:hypothetical protein
VVSESFCEVDGGEGSLAYFPFGLEQFMEVSLVDFLLEGEGPFFGDGGMGRVERELLLAVLSL